MMMVAKLERQHQQEQRQQQEQQQQWDAVVVVDWLVHPWAKSR